jgi:hypothetical protein
VTVPAKTQLPPGSKSFQLGDPAKEPPKGGFFVYRARDYSQTERISRGSFIRYDLKQQGAEMKNLLTITLAAIFFASLNAKATALEGEIFQCETGKNKTIKITRLNDKLIYTYSQNKKEDIRIEKDLYNENIPGVFSPGVIMANKSGPYIYNTVIFNKGEYEYNVTALSDVNVPSVNTFSGVYVQKNGKRIAKIKCQEKTIKDNFESLYK